jgi:hypothetical protein
MGCLTVLVLKSLPQIKELQGLQGCPALRAVSFTSCASLLLLDLDGQTRLEMLHIRECVRLKVVCGMELGSFTRLVIAGCDQLPNLDLRGPECALVMLDMCSLGLLKVCSSIGVLVACH